MKILGWILGVSITLALFIARIYLWAILITVYVSFVVIRAIIISIRNRAQKLDATKIPAYPTLPENKSSAPKKSPKTSITPLDRQLIYDTADSCLTYADELEYKAIQETNPIKRAHWFSMANNQRVRAERLVQDFGDSC